MTKEEIIEAYRNEVRNKNWARLNELGLIMQELGYADLEVELSNELTAEEIKECREWDRQVNGSTETQMDDGSDNIDRL